MVDTIVAPARRRPLLTSSLTITALTVLARIAVGVRDLLVAREFGISSNVDAFFIALAVPTLLAVAVSGALQTAVVPGEAAFRAAGRPPRDLLAPVVRAVSRWLLLVAAAIVVLAWPIVRLLGSGFDDETAADARGLLCLIAAVVVLGGIAGSLSGALASQRRFGAAVSGQVINGVLAVVIFLVFEQALGITAAALGVLLGYVAEVVVLAVIAGLPWARVLAGRFDATQRETSRSVLRSAGPLLVATLVTSTNTVIDQAFAATLASGSVAALGYASKIVLFASIPLAAVSLAAFPSLSELAVSGDKVRLRALVVRRSAQIALAGALLIPLVVLVGRVGVDLLLDSQSATSTSAIHGPLTAYALMLPAYGVGILLARVLAALGRSRWVMAVAIANAATNTLGDFLLKEPLGITGIALSTTIVQTSSCIALLICVGIALRPTDRIPATVGAA
jgi:putative peptidoglycan lipid II flippase